MSARPEDRAKGVGRSALATDDPAPIGLSDSQLEEERAVVLNDLAYFDLVWIIDQSPGQELEQVLQAEIPLALRSLFTVFVGRAPLAIQPRTRSSSMSMVDGSVCGS